jgi:hypothetical protein
MLLVLVLPFSYDLHELFVGERGEINGGSGNSFVLELRNP